MTNFIAVYYGFFAAKIKFDATLYPLSGHIYNLNLKDKFLFNKQQYSKEKFWKMNYYKSQEGLIRDIYPINILNNNQLNQPVVDNIPLRDYIKNAEIGSLSRFNDELFIWKVEAAIDIEKSKTLKKKANSGVFLNE